MRKYTPFFQTLHDEASPTGTFGRGTHYSVLRATVFHDAAGKPLPHAKAHDFAVAWDEDHDERVFDVIDEIDRAGLLPAFVIFGERKGSFTAVVSDSVGGTARLGHLEEHVNRIAQEHSGDLWPGDVVRIGQPMNPIISETDENVTLYLSNLRMLWGLGSRLCPSPSSGTAIGRRSLLRRIQWADGRNAACPHQASRGRYRADRQKG